VTVTSQDTPCATFQFAPSAPTTTPQLQPGLV
jgi:hypothetical protein